MGTKRPFEEELQEFIKHPKHCDYGNKPTLFVDDKPPAEKSQNFGIAGEGDGVESVNVFTVPDMVYKGFQASAPLPLVTGINGDEEDGVAGAVFCSDFFPEFFEFNVPRRQIVHYDDAYSSFFNSSRVKEVPVGPDHQADVPDFDPEVAQNFLMNYDKNGRKANFMGVCVVPMPDSDNSSQGESVGSRMECKCVDGGSVRCVQQHVKEARLKLKQSLGDEKFVDLGMCEMGEEVAFRWTEEEERIFHEVVYCNPASLGKKFWDELRIAFLSRTKKELVSYYFNVFILRRRAVQNRSNFLEIDSDDDEWWGSDRTPLGVRAEDEDFVVGGSFFDHGDNDSSSEDPDNDNDGGQRDVFMGTKDDMCTSFEDQDFQPRPCKQVDENSSVLTHDDRATSESKGGSRPEYESQPFDAKVWDVPYTSTCPTKDV